MSAVEKSGVIGIITEVFDAFQNSECEELVSAVHHCNIVSLTSLVGSSRGWARNLLTNYRVYRGLIFTAVSLCYLQNKRCLR